MSSSSSSPSSASSSSSNLSFRLRASADRGHANHGWLNSYHTFSFANYHDAAYPGFSSLRVINEDRVSGGQGFGRHGHSNFEIFSYVLSGSLQHDDSLGNTELLKRGHVQFTSAGKGISHSEYNGSKKRDDTVHFLQMWVQPNERNTQPNYQTRYWPDQHKQGQLRLIIAPDGVQSPTPPPHSEQQGEQPQPPIRIHQDARVYASLLSDGQSVTHDVQPNRTVYIHLSQDAAGFDREKRETAININGGAVKLQDGDGVFVRLTDPTQPAKLTITANNKGSKSAEFILFDLVNPTKTQPEDDEEEDFD